MSRFEDRLLAELREMWPVETIGEACLRVQREYSAAKGRQATKGADEHRRQVWALAIDRGATYRELGDLLGMSHSNLFRLLEGYVQRERTNSGVMERRF